MAWVALVEAEVEGLLFALSIAFWFGLVVLAVMDEGVVVWGFHVEVDHFWRVGFFDLFKGGGFDGELLRVVFGFLEILDLGIFGGLELELVWNGKERW